MDKKNNVENLSMMISQNMYSSNGLISPASASHTLVKGKSSEPNNIKKIIEEEKEQKGLMTPINPLQRTSNNLKDYVKGKQGQDYQKCKH